MRLPAGDVAARVVSSLRIVVVGAGVAGLAAAAALLRDAPAADVLVLEARPGFSTSDRGSSRTTDDPRTFVVPSHWDRRGTTSSTPMAG